MMFQMPASVTYNTVERSKRQLITLGAFQIVIGALCIIFNAVALGVVHGYVFSFAVIGHGFWCGILFIVTGSFGVTAGKQKSRCMIITFMVLSIIAAAFTIILLIFGIMGAALSRHSCYYSHYNSYECNRSTAVAMDSLLAIFGFIEAIVAISSAAICCKSGACSCNQNPTAVMPSVGYLPNNGQVIWIGQAQGGQQIGAPTPMIFYPQGLNPLPANVQQGYATIPPQMQLQMQPTASIGPMFVQQPPNYDNIVEKDQMAQRVKGREF